MGTLSSGGNPGVLTIDGELEFDDGATLLVDPAADLLAVTADVFLGGTLALQAGQPMGDLSAGEWGESTRNVLTTSGEEGAIVDTFENVPADGDHVGSGVFFKEVTYDPGETFVAVSVFQGAPGDTNGDREINNIDLQGILAANSFNNPGDWEWIHGDFNGDGGVDNTDLQLVLATGFFGQGDYMAAAPAAAGLVAVPEPATLVLLASGVLGLLLNMWRRRKLSRLDR